jgi:hypothetical protein
MEITITEKEVERQVKRLLKLRTNLRFLLLSLDGVEAVKALPIFKRLNEALRGSLVLVESSLATLAALEREGGADG